MSTADIDSVLASAAPAPRIPWLGLGAVLLGTFVSTVNSRLSTFGLADIRGAVHASFDEGAWITTAQAVAQMLIAPAAIWLGGVYGARRVLMEAAAAFALVCLIEPYAPNIQTLLGLQFVGGLASGFFIPLTLGFVLRNMPPKVWAYGIALYALNLEVSLNISASLEDWYIQHLSWRWIFWQNVPLALGMWYCLKVGARPEELNAAHPPPDWFGLLAGGIGLGLIYAALDQGNRLDWQNSGLVWGLMASGAVLLVAFLVNERLSANPGLNLRVAFTAPLPRLLVLVGFLRLTILSTAYLIPQFLITVRGYRALEVGQTLIWLAIPQLFICLIAGYSMRRMDPRFVASCGFILICVGCLMVAHGLTPNWGTNQFLPSQLVQAVGQSFALSGTVFFAILHLRPQDALTFGAAIQTARLMGGEIGLAFITTFLRVRGQVASNLLGQHVQIGDEQVLQRIQTYGAATARAGDPTSIGTRGAAILNNVVHATAVTQGILDAFVVLAAATAITVMLVVTRGAAPQGPASHVPLLARRAARLP
ncbi:MAG TPA: MFS transporter [Steroidobacteraceae bacterium]|nr:MFS transporter [Steroidobacteraceae bacterium]